MTEADNENSNENSKLYVYTVYKIKQFHNYLSYAVQTISQSLNGVRNEL